MSFLLLVLTARLLAVLNAAVPPGPFCQGELWREDDLRWLKSAALNMDV